MSNANVVTTVSLSEAVDLAIANPKKVYFWTSDPGCGKTSQLNAIKRRLGDGYTYIYFDMANKDIGDLALPMPNHEHGITQYFLNGIFKHYEGKPLVIVYDEWSKAPQAVQNALHTSIEITDPRIFDWFLPEGSIRILTGNNSGDGLGDNIKAHTLNRVTKLHIRKPNSEEWLQWAVNNDIDPVVMAWVDRFPHALASYTDGGQDENPYIFNPKRVQTSYVSPRSLELVSHSLKNRDKVSANAMLADMIGTIGEAGARDMHAFVEYQDQMPSWDVIIKDPRGATLPHSANACAVMAFSAIRRVDKDTITPFMEYLDRMSPEFQAMFAINIAKDSTKQTVAFSSKAFRDWCTANEDIL